MKKVLSLLIFALSFSFVNAQHFGIEAGPVFSSMAIGNDVILLKTNLKPGFMAGITVDFPIKENMLINVGVGYKTMGTSIQNGSFLLKEDTVDIAGNRTGNAYINTSYAYLFNLEKLDVFVEGGAYFGYAISGKKFLISTDGTEETEDMLIGTEVTDDLEPMDLGLLIGGGVYYNKWKFSVGYQFGLTNLNPSYDVTTNNGDLEPSTNRNTYRNGMFNIKVAYLFNKK